MMTFRSAYDFHHENFSPSGSPLVTQYRMIVDPATGCRDLEKCGELNLQERIDSYAEDCKIDNILRRFVGGDISALNRGTAQYVDLSTYPKNFHDATAQINRVKSFYNQLPDQVHEEFPTFEKFLSAVSEGKFTEKAPVVEVSRDVANAVAPVLSSEGGDLNESK